MSVGRSRGRSGVVGQTVSRAGGRAGGRLVGRSVGRSVRRSVGRSGRSVRWAVGRLEPAPSVAVGRAVEGRGVARRESDGLLPMQGLQFPKPSNVLAPGASPETVNNREPVLARSEFALGWVFGLSMARSEFAEFRESCENCKHAALSGRLAGMPASASSRRMGASVCARSIWATKF